MRINKLAISLSLAVLVAGVSLGCKGGGGHASRAASHAAIRRPGPDLGNPTGIAAERREPVSLAHTPGLAQLEGQPPGSQRICPVSGQPFGGNRDPIPIIMKGEPVLVCSPDCAKKLQKNPNRYLAKLSAQRVATE